MRVVVDASNLVSGGGKTHLIQFLENLPPTQQSLDFIILGAHSLESLLPNRSFIKFVPVDSYRSRLFSFVLWQFYYVHKICQEFSADLLLVPGGIYLGSFRPFVSMCQNMAPFTPHLFLMYLWPITSINRIFKLLLAHLFHVITFSQSLGVVFLTDFAKRQICSLPYLRIYSSIVIPHGISSRFISDANNKKFEISKLNFNAIYVASYEPYHHQINVIKAIAHIRDNLSYDVKLNLYGYIYLPYFKKIKNFIIKNNYQSWALLNKPIPYSEIHKVYKESDFGIFASSCENLPNTLLELMASGIPLVSSAYEPMASIFPLNTCQFDPFSYISLSKKIELIIRDKVTRNESISKALFYSKKYNWSESSNLLANYLIKLG